MPAPSPEERIAALTEKKRQLDAQIARLNAQKSAADRKRDTRRKILVGAVVLKEVSGNVELAKWLRQLLDLRLVTARDRSYFELPIKSEEKANDNEQHVEQDSTGTP